MIWFLLMIIVFMSLQFQQSTLGLLIFSLQWQASVGNLDRYSKQKPRNELCIQPQITSAPYQETHEWSRYLTHSYNFLATWLNQIYVAISFGSNDLLHRLGTSGKLNLLNAGGFSGYKNPKGRIINCQNFYSTSPYMKEKGFRSQFLLGRHWRLTKLNKRKEK